MTSKVACCFFIWTRMRLNEMWLKNIQEITYNKYLKLRFEMLVKYFWINHVKLLSTILYIP